MLWATVISLNNERIFKISQKNQIDFSIFCLKWLGYHCISRRPIFRIELLELKLLFFKQNLIGFFENKLSCISLCVPCFNDCSGWGTVASGGLQSPELKVATVTGISNALCQSKYPREVLSTYNICAAKTGTDTCQGDSGGIQILPLFCNFLMFRNLQVLLSNLKSKI